MQAHSPHRVLICALATVLLAACSSDSSTDPALAASCEPTPYTLGTTVSGTFTVGDCDFVGHPEGLIDNYVFTLTAQTYVRFTTSGSASSFDLEVDGWPNPTDLTAFVVSPPVGNTVWAVLPAGSYLMMMQSFSRAGVGSYTLAADMHTDINNCITYPNNSVVIRPGVVVAGRFTSGDCSLNQVVGGPRVDHFTMPMFKGKTYKFSTTSPGYAMGLEVYTTDGSVACAPSDFQESGKTALSCTPTADAFYTINVWSPVSNGGDYALTVSPATN